MAINLYVTSTQDFSGKSAVCVAMMHRMQKDGYRVGYFKPFSSAARVLAESSTDEDARFIKDTFKLTESLETLAPVVLTNQQVLNILREGDPGFTAAVQKAAQVVGQGKDIIIMEGSANFREGRIVKLSPGQTMTLVDAKVITVIGYHDSQQIVDDALTALSIAGDRLIGIIYNNVPQSRLTYVNSAVKSFLQQKGIETLAVLPHQQVLSSISVCDIVEALQGELLTDNCEEILVENLMIAAMDVEQALKHFRRVINKAVIVGGDRPDVQLVALETSTRALILTGNLRPNPMIEAKAREKGVAIILSSYDTFVTVEKVEEFFGKTRFYQTEKVTMFEELLGEAVNFDALYQTIGLSK